MKTFGLLLAGGRSSRFGREKAVAPFGDGLLMDPPLRALAGACEATAVAARTDSGAAAVAAARGYPVLADPPGAARGPLAGVLAGLEWAAAGGATHLATAPCDAATLRADQMARLVECARLRDGPAAALSGVGLEPLVAVWPVALTLPVVAEALSGGGHPGVRALLAGLDVLGVEGFDGANVNDQGQLAALEAQGAVAAPRTRT